MTASRTAIECAFWACHPNHAPRQPAEERQNLRTPKLLAQNRRTQGC
jgi:hypothetical protein